VGVVSAGLPEPEPVGASEAIRTLLTARARSVLGTREPAVPIQAAARAVADDLGGPAMVVLASLYADADPDVVDDALAASLREVGWETAAMSFPDAALFVARARAAHVVSGELSGRAFGRWAHAAFAWDERLPDVMDPLWELDLLYGEFDEDAVGEPDPLAVAWAFLIETEDPSTRWRIG
jgi:hypothetical protein